MGNAQHILVVSTLVALVAGGCSRSGIGVNPGGPDGGSGGSSSGGVQSGGVGGSGSGGQVFGGVTGSGGSEAICPPLPCSATPCPEGETPLALFDCDCSGPCGCWQCVSAPGTGGTMSSGGASGGTGGAISNGGVSGSSGGSAIGGASGSGGSSAICIQPPCGEQVCPAGYVVAPSNDCDCSGPCGCPCGCFTCAPAETPDASIRLDAPVSDGPGTAGDAKVPLQHRSTSASCPSQRGPAPGSQPYPSVSFICPYAQYQACSSDSACTDGANGRCFLPDGQNCGGCSYDECSSDSSCGTKTPCICRGSSTDNSANICDSGGNCAVDSDCGPGGYCSPSMEDCAWALSANPDVEAEGSSGPKPYYCHTVSDLCINDSDCAPPDAGTATTSSCPQYTPCAYNVQDKRWECAQFVCCPP